MSAKKLVAVVLFVALLSTANAQNAPEPSHDQMAAWLTTAFARIGLNGRGRAPYHLKGSYTVKAEDGTQTVGTLDLLHINDRESASIFTNPDVRYAAYLHNEDVFTAGDPSKFRAFQMEAITITTSWIFREPLNAAQRLDLTYQQVEHDGVSLDCIDNHGVIGNHYSGEPTRFCLDPHTHDLISVSGGKTEPVTTFSQQQPFGERFVPRSLRVAWSGKFQMTFHIDSVELAMESAISLPPEAKKVQPVAGMGAVMGSMSK